MTVASAFIVACFLLLTNNYDLAAAVIVAKKEKWRRVAIWNRVRDFRALTGIPIGSPIISLIVGSEERALQASRFSLARSLSLSLLTFTALICLDHHRTGICCNPSYCY